MDAWAVEISYKAVISHTHGAYCIQYCDIHRYILADFELVLSSANFLMYSSLTQSKMFSGLMSVWII